jgi:DNA-binding LacI/PurR family transcriptional regulator
MAVTIRDVARKCGVSVATVSRVINESDLVNEDTKKKVKEVIEQLGFMPNTTARRLSTRSSNMIGVMVPNISNPFFGELIQGIEERASEAGYDIIISSYKRENLYDDVVALRSRDIEGLIMSVVTSDDRALDYLYENGCPFVLTGPINYSRPVNYVTVDNKEGGKIAVEHLIKLGHRKIGYIQGNPESYINFLRLEGYKKALFSHKIELNAQYVFSEDLKETLDKILKMKERPTAIFAFNDDTALCLMEGLARNGLNVPQDIALVGFDSVKMSSFYSIELTTVDNRQFEFGRQAVDLLIQSINGDKNKTQQIIKTPQLIIRKSCGSKK